MHYESKTDVNLLLSAVSVVSLALLLKLPETRNFAGRVIYDLWWLMRRVW